MVSMRDRIPTAFISFAADELTKYALTGSKLVEITSAYAADFGVDIPHARYPFVAPNKRTALLENLLCFAPKQQYQIIRELCDRLNPEGNISQLVALKVKLVSQYRDFADEDNATDIHRTLVVDLRLGLETLTRQIFGNHKSLENQISQIGQFVKEKHGSPQLANMFEKLVDYYCKYQNTYVKHDDAVITAEIEFIFELTSSFMKHLIRLKNE